MNYYFFLDPKIDGLESSVELFNMPPTNIIKGKALKNKKITVFGGKQKRPNIHIDDIIGVYLFFVKNNFKA